MLFNGIGLIVSIPLNWKTSRPRCGWHRHLWRGVDLEGVIHLDMRQAETPERLQRLRTGIM